MFTLTEIRNASKEQAGKAFEAISLLNHILASEEFESGINGAVMTEMNGKTKADVIAFARMDHSVKFSIYYEDNSVVGYVVNDGWIYMNTKFYDDIPGICGNVLHETMHKCGFKHPKYPKRWYRPSGYTTLEVPYSAGKVVEAIAKIWIKEAAKEKEPVLA